MIQINKDPSPRDRFLFCFLWFPLFVTILSVASWFYFIFSHDGKYAQDALRNSFTIWSVGAGLVLAFGIFPTFGKKFMVTLMYIGFPIGFVVSHLVMILIWYLVFTPIGLLLRILGKDVLDMKIDPSAKTYWKKKPEPRPLKDYFRQF